MSITQSTGYAGRVFVNSHSNAEKMLNYSRAVRDGEWVFLANTSGVRYEDGFLAEDIEEQAAQMIANVTSALEAAGGSVQDIVRVVIFFPDRDDLPKITQILADFLSDIRPAATFLCSPLAAARLKIEMEATARIATGSEAM